MLEGTPLPAAGNGEGAFRMWCNSGQLLYDDPIVYPGQPGASHLHQFFGNLAADGNSTYASLLADGDSTCDGGPTNRSGYWVPALIDPDPNGDQVVVPDGVIVYYKGEPWTGVQPLPEGLRMVAGYDVANDRPRDSFSWHCETNGYTAAPLIGDCGPGDLIASIDSFPQCWDGTNLDSADHRSHMTYTIYDGSGPDPVCPASHPVLLPRITYKVFWTVQAGENTTDWQLSSDHHNGTLRPGGTTFHADWFGAWNTDISDRWYNGCLIGYHDCNTGAPGAQLGDGGQLIRPAPAPTPTRVPLPPPPAPHGLRSLTNTPTIDATTTNYYCTIN